MREIKIRVQLIDADTGGLIGQSTSATTRVRDDLAYGPFPDHAQDQYALTVGNTGTQAYLNSFPRKERHAEGTAGS